MKRSALALTVLLAAGARPAATLANHVEWDGSRTPFVHRIPLYDEDGEKILPDLPGAKPFSARQTCGRCHSYEEIGKGWHFNAGQPDADRGRPGQAWIHTAPELGVQVPVSERGWARTWHPRDLGLTPWQMTREFGRHMPGGGTGETDDPTADPESRWDVSGRLENNCLGCHSAAAGQDMGEWARQVGRENFRWAATAAAGIAEVGGMALRMRDTWLPSDGRDPDDSEYAIPPFVRYDRSQFDNKGRILLDLEGIPPSRRCQYCHSNSYLEEEKVHTDDDVHVARGMRCGTCHRNEVDHRIARGYEGQFSAAEAAEHADMSCRGCHLEAAGQSGRQGAPLAVHRGLPPLHLERMRCTVCHSGAATATGVAQVRTARANRLGIYGAARWDRNEPAIVEPVIMKDTAGLLAPHRMVWPAFWARLDGQGVKPLPDETVAAAAVGVTDVQAKAARLLSALAGGERAKGAPVLIVEGRRYRANADGGLEVAGEGNAAGDARWSWEKEGAISPVVPAINLGAFDPVTNPADAEIESDLLDTLKALGRAAGEGRTAVLCVGRKIFRLTEDGVVEQQDRPGGGEATSPEPAWLAGEALVPLLSDFDTRTIKATVGAREALTEEQVALVLGALAKTGGDGACVYIANGRLFKADGAGGLTAEDHPAAEPHAWPVGHDVRPAAQALGAGGCRDCHEPNAPFFFRTVTALGPLQTSHSAARPMAAYMDQAQTFHRLFGLLFAIRPLFKQLLCAFGALIGIAVAGAVIVLLAAFSKSLSRGPAAAGRFRWLDPLTVALASLTFVALAATGFGGLLIRGCLSGFTLLTHTAGGFAFAAFMAALVVLRGRAYCFGPLCPTPRFPARRKVAFWLMVLCAWLLISSIFLSVLPLFGTEGQHILLGVHRYSAWVALFAAALYAWPARAVSRRND